MDAMGDGPPPDLFRNKVNTDKIDKLQSLHETLSKKSFLSMKEVMLLNEARKIINNAKR
jgi:hypothetical protein